MFNLSYIREVDKAEGTIYLKKPLTGLGVVEDFYGKRWHINGIFGKYNVSAVPFDELHPYYTDTSTFGRYGIVSQKWDAYKIEVVGEQA